MDTRNKIIALEQANAIAESQAAVCVTGHFDPMLAQHARQISNLRQPGKLLIALVTNSAEPYLPQQARAELVAALASVDWVALQPGTMDDPESARITRNFVAQVVDRHQGAQS